MGVTFFESMSGELLDTDGRAHHVAFDLRCEASRLLGFLSNGRTRATGTIRAQPWADGEPCRGHVTVRPLLGRFIEYDLDFTGTDGKAWRLFGRKDVDPLRPLESMTNLATRLERDGELVASGTMRFDLNELPAFLRSWSLDTDFRTIDEASPSGDGLPAPPLLDEAEKAVLAALAEALIVPFGRVPPADGRTAELAAGILPHLPPLLVSGYRLGLRTLDLAATARHGRGFAALELERRRALLEALIASNQVSRALVQTLGMPVCMAHFSRRDYLDAVGLPDYRNPVREADERWQRSVHVPEALDAETEVECDAVVVGTGAGGAALAAALAERCLAVVLVEEGRYQRRPQFAGGPEERLLKFWRDGGMNIVLGNAPLVVPVGRLVGGSTAINSGTCYRTPHHVLDEWRRAGFPEDFQPERFGEWLDRVEAELQVRPADPRYLGRFARTVAAGAAQMGGHYGPLHRNAPDCDGQGICSVGCPTGAKRSSDVSWVPRALRAGAELYTGLPVTRLLMRDRRAVGVVAEGQDRCGAPRRVTIRARAVVLACGSLYTPLLLQRNGVRLPWLGRNLSIHPALGVFALHPEDLGTPWQSIPQGTYVEGLVDERVRFEGFYAPPQMAAPTLGFTGAELSRWMDAWARVGQYGFMVRDTGVGSVGPGPAGRPLLRYSITPEVLERFRRGSAAMAEMLLRGGAQEIATGIEGVGIVKTVEAARAIAAAPLRARHFRSMGFHPLGTCRMGRSADEAVVDFRNRVFGTQNVYVADGSCVPTSLGVNPQITIMAMALRAADLLAEDLGA